MSEEIKKVEEKCCCVCKFVKCEECKKFLIVALGTFVGAFCALSLFFALHKPPMMGPHHGHHMRHGGPMMERGFGHRHHAHRMAKPQGPDFRQIPMDKNGFGKAAAPEAVSPDEIQE